MSPVAPRRSGGLINLSPSTVVAVAVVAASLLVVVLVGVPRLRSQAPSTAGLVPVPTAAVPIAAHTRIKRDHLWDAANARIAVVYLPPRAVTKEMLLNISDIIGRVLDGDKRPGYVFTEEDFLPRGTREGLVAGIPAGKRAIRVSGDRLDGLAGLNAGDHSPPAMFLRGIWVPGVEVGPQQAGAAHTADDPCDFDCAPTK